MDVAGWRGGTTDLCPGRQKPSRCSRGMTYARNPTTENLDASYSFTAEVSITADLSFKSHSTSSTITTATTTTTTTTLADRKSPPRQLNPQNSYNW